LLRDIRDSIRIDISLPFSVQATPLAAMGRVDSITLMHDTKSGLKSCQFEAHTLMLEFEECGRSESPNACISLMRYVLCILCSLPGWLLQWLGFDAL